MIFNGKPIDALTDDEIRSLVDEHIAERLHLEFKATVNLRGDDDKHELLRDIASLANGGGGYFVVGISDDGKGRAQAFVNPGDTGAIAKSILDLCLVHITERISGLEVRERQLDGRWLVIVRIPPSRRRAHMVTYKGSTDFWCRYESGKRPMTLGEIREALREPQAEPPPVLDRLKREWELIERRGGPKNPFGRS